MPFIKSLAMRTKIKVCPFRNDINLHYYNIIEKKKYINLLIIKCIYFIFKIYILIIIKIIFRRMEPAGASANTIRI